MRSLGLLCSLAVALGGCTLINQPDASRIGMTDGGMDGGDGGDADADGVDGGDADAGDGGDGCADNQEICDNGEDDNCNGLVDCNDFGCAQLERCCDRPTAVALDYTDTLNTWMIIPEGGGGMPLLDGMGNITDFMGGGSPTGYLIRYCLPLEAGYEISTTFTRATEACSPGDSTCFGRIALTPAGGSAVGGKVPEDIGVEMSTAGAIVVTQAGASIPLLDEVAVPAGGWVKVTLTLTAGQYPEGEAAVVATVRAAFSGGLPAGTVLLENEPIAPRDRLLTGPGALCDESRGLRLAVEGAGSQIHVAPIQTVALQCLNLGRFSPPADDGPLAATGIGESMPQGNLDWAGWGAGGVGAPSLLRQPTSGAGGWHVFGDATDLDRGEEGATPMSFRVGHSSAGAMLWDEPAWATAEDGDPVPRFGPSCSGADPCWSDGYSIREPSVIDTGGGTSFSMAAAVRIDAAEPDTYGLYVGPIDLNKAIQYDPPVTIAPSDILPSGACDSLRHPSLVAAGSAPAIDGYWLFFTCEKEFEAEPARWDIRVTKLNPDRTLDSTLAPQVVVATAAGTFRASAVYAPEVIVDRDGATEDTYRLWYLARDQNQEVSIGFAQGQQTADDPANGRPATFVQYSANPILRDGPSFFDACLDCVTTGLAVARTNSSTLRFLFARSDDDGTAWDRRFVPAEQHWSQEATPPPELP